MKGKSHRFFADSDGFDLELGLSGHYFANAHTFVDAVCPQWVEIRLDKIDTEKMKRKLRDVSPYVYKLFLGPNIYWRLEPRQDMVDVATGKEPWTRFIVPINGVGLVEALLEKPLTGSGVVDDENGVLIVGDEGRVKSVDNESRVVKYIKRYDIIESLIGRKLRDLQTLTRLVEEAEPPLSPSMDTDQAKHLVEQELKIIEHLYTKPMPRNYVKNAGPIRYVWEKDDPVDRELKLRNRALWSLLKIQFGEEFFNSLNNTLTSKDFAGNFRNEEAWKFRYSEALAIMKTNGYIPKFDETDFSIHFALHMLEFLKQAYTINPSKILEEYAKLYKSEKPQILIHANNYRHLKNPKSLSLPTYAQLHWISTESPDGSFVALQNDNESETRFYARIPLNGNSRFLELQEHALSLVGITFR